MRGNFTTRARVRAITVAALGLALLALGAASASAVIVHVGSKPLSYQPLRGVTRLSVSPFAKARPKGKNLLYHGGPVMPANTNYTFYWAPSGAPAYAAGYQTGVNKYLEDLAHDSGGNQNVDSVATQYTDSAAESANYNSHFGGQLLDTQAYPANGCVVAAKCITDEQIRAEITRYVEENKLPHGLEHEYFLLTPPGVESCFDSTGKQCSAGTPTAAYCAYHGAISTEKGPIIYSNDPYVVGIEGCDSKEHPNGPSDAALLGGLSHEHNESITDPELDAWYGPEGNENGDKCRTFVESSEYGTPLGTAEDGSRYNQLINGAKYWYQQEWSNQGSTCLQRLAPVPPTITKLAPKKGPAAGGTPVTITGTGFSGVLAVRFGPTPATTYKVESPTRITATAPPGTVGTVEVRVEAGAGTSPATNKDRFKYTAK